ncbi:MAG: uracil-DNA glycosylase [Lachnospiraceae bacterium]
MIEKEWDLVLQDEFIKEYYKALEAFLEHEYNQYQIFPKREEIFSAFKATPLSKVKVVILGQDPYHDINQAHGMSFSIQREQQKIPPSLVNIYKEVISDLNLEMPNHGNLSYWAEQGVLLLNTVLTVRAHEAHSHKGKGWEEFTNAVISILNKEDRPIVFLLWGKPALKAQKLLNNKKHLVLYTAHPSPLSSYRGFFGCKHFSKTNDFLITHNILPIDWQIT